MPATKKVTKPRTAKERQERVDATLAEK